MCVTCLCWDFARSFVTVSIVLRFILMTHLVPKLKVACFRFFVFFFASSLVFFFFFFSFSSLEHVANDISFECAALGCHYLISFTVSRKRSRYVSHHRQIGNV